MNHLSSKEAQNWAMYTHLGGLVGSFATGITGTSLGGPLGALLFWLIKRDQSDFVDAHGRESLNFQINLLAWFWLGVFLTPLLIGIPILIVAGIMGIVCPILGCAAASRGDHYRYPLTLRFF